MNGRDCHEFFEAVGVNPRFLTALIPEFHHLDLLAVFVGRQKEGFGSSTVSGAVLPMVQWCFRRFEIVFIHKSNSFQILHHLAPSSTYLLSKLGGLQTDARSYTMSSGKAVGTATTGSFETAGG